MKDNALTLFQHAGLVTGNENAEAIFTTEITTMILPKNSKEITKTTDPAEVARLVAEGGTIVGRKSVVKQAKQSDARTMLSLKGKDNQPQWEMTKREAERFGANIIRNRLSTLDWDRVGLKRFAETIGKDGLTVLDIKLKELPIKEGSVTLEQALEAWKGVLTREQILDMFAKAGIRPKGMQVTNVDVKSEIVPPAQLPEKATDEAREAALTEEQVKRNEANEQARKDNPKRK